MAKPLAVLATASAVLHGVLATPKASDPCAKIAGQTFVAPADALACYKAFSFNETLRQNGTSGQYFTCPTGKMLNALFSRVGSVSCLRLLHIRGLLL
jgi:hypothetical protein